MKAYKFRAKIEAGMGGGAFVAFPFDVEKEFGTKGRVPVKVMIEGVPYSGSLVACGGSQHLLGVLKAIREQTGQGYGDEVEVEIWKDDGERFVEIPAAFEQRMRGEGLLPFFDGLSYTNRKEYCRWITEAKKEETRLIRLEKAVAMLKRGVRTPG